MNEWEFTGEAVSWINQTLERQPSLPFYRARLEQKATGSQKRRDLSLLDKNERVVLTGEIKLPYEKDGSSPYNDTVVSDARSKAQRAGTRFFFTWNVNEFVLWETDPEKVGLDQQKYRSWGVTEVHKESHLDLAPTLHSIRSFLDTFLKEFSEIMRGTAAIGMKLPDERFLDMLESYLRLPIVLTHEQLLESYREPRFKKELDRWMREEQGWTITDDPDGIRENLENASKFACYDLINKLVFHEALLKRFRPRMDSLSVPEHITTGEDLRLHLEGYFDKAKKATGDYETVFGEDHKTFGNRIPFYAERAVPHWRELINQINKFDFSRLDYEIIGQIFERLISPEERHKFGQYYTRPEVVDLINSFCIRTGEEKVMDPACGGGTFLVRAYARKRELAPSRSHAERIAELFGVDVSSFAAHLTTINLATRDLVEEENYPQIVRSDFFDIKIGKTFIKLPRHIQARGLGKSQQRDIDIPSLDAVVGNPPYVRQKDIPKAKNKARDSGTQEYYQKMVKDETSANLSGRSDLHCYFWPHASTFLKEDGYLCLLTSSQWLDVEYGFRLQEWILNSFRVIAIFESIDEPWFVGARVATAVTILQRESDEAARTDNTVRFVQLRRPIKEIFAHDTTTADAVNVADSFRDEILGLKNNEVNERYRARLVKQGDLWKIGVELGKIMEGTPAIDSDTEDDGEEATGLDLIPGQGKYIGGKWGVYVRAPDLWFRIIDNYGHSFSILSQIAEVHRGITSGNDSFFFPIDCTTECVNAVEDPVKFVEKYGIERSLAANGTVLLVRAGEGRGEIHAIESRYLEPEVHSLMEIDGFTVSAMDCRRLLLMVHKKKDQLKGTYVLKYIKWGESNNVHRGSTCASRVTPDREWYDLTGHVRGSLFWSKSQQYKHAVPANDHNLQCSSNLYDVSPRNGDSAVLAGVLNSTWTVLTKFQYGRPVGVEGNLKTEIVDVNMMRVPDPSNAPSVCLDRVRLAFERMKQRKALAFLSERRLRQMAYTSAGRVAELASLSDLTELDMPDRRELDDAVLEMIGVNNQAERSRMIDELYVCLSEYFEIVRQKEEKAILNKNKTRRRGRARPTDIAKEIHERLVKDEPGLLLSYETDFLDRAMPFDTYDIPAEGVPRVYSDMMTPNAVKFLKGSKTTGMISTPSKAQSELVACLANQGLHGLQRVPHGEAESAQLLDKYRSFIQRRDARLWELVKERSADEETQGEILTILKGMFEGR